MIQRETEAEFRYVVYVVIYTHDHGLLVVIIYED